MQISLPNDAKAYIGISCKVKMLHSFPFDFYLLIPLPTIHTIHPPKSPGDSALALLYIALGRHPDRLGQGVRVSGIYHFQISVS